MAEPRINVQSILIRHELVRRLFGDGVGSAPDLEQANGSVDVVLASDLLEHLPLEGIDRVIAEAARVARSAVILSFFNMAEISEHRDRPVAAYHWNRLSRARVEAALAAQFPRATVVPIHAWLQRDSSTGARTTSSRSRWSRSATHPPRRHPCRSRRGSVSPARPAACYRRRQTAGRAARCI